MFRYHCTFTYSGMPLRMPLPRYVYRSLHHFLWIPSHCSELGFRSYRTNPTTPWDPARCFASVASPAHCIIILKNIVPRQLNLLLYCSFLRWIYFFVPLVESISLITRHQLNMLSCCGLIMFSSSVNSFWQIYFQSSQSRLQSPANNSFLFGIFLFSSHQDFLQITGKLCTHLSFSHGWLARLGQKICRGSRMRNPRNSWKSRTGRNQAHCPQESSKYWFREASRSGHPCCWTEHIFPSYVLIPIRIMVEITFLRS